MTLSQQKSSLSFQFFEIGKLYSDRGDFIMAIPKLLQASEGFFQEREYSSYLTSMNLILRMYAELEKSEEILKIKEKLQDLVLKEGFELNSKTYYTLALCASFRGQNESSLEYLQKALAIALATDNKEDICYAINGIAICYKNLGKYAEALKEIYNLQVFFQVLDVPEVRIGVQMVNAQILNGMKKHDQALEILWQAYDMMKKHKVLVHHVGFLYNLGRTYFYMGEKELARTHFRLATKICDPKNMIRMARAIQLALEELGGEATENYDLVFELENHAVTERKLGRVDFKNQFILLDLLRLFVQNQGQVYSKEYLVESVWKQTYDPAVHDNKIYVTIKRLRKMIEPDYDKPKYIFRAKNGYFMNKSAKIYIDLRGE